jgi:hypothetical protein
VGLEFDNPFLITSQHNNSSLTTTICSDSSLPQPSTSPLSLEGPPHRNPNVIHRPSVAGSHESTTLCPQSPSPGAHDQATSPPLKHPSLCPQQLQLLPSCSTSTTTTSPSPSLSRLLTPHRSSKLLARSRPRLLVLLRLRKSLPQATSQARTTLRQP